MRNAPQLCAPLEYKTTFKTGCLLLFQAVEVCVSGTVRIALLECPGLAEIIALLPVPLHSLCFSELKDYFDCLALGERHMVDGKFWHYSPLSPVVEGF